MHLFGTIALELRALASYPAACRWQLLEADWAYDSKGAEATEMDCDEFYEAMYDFVDTWVCPPPPTPALPPSHEHAVCAPLPPNALTCP